METIFKGFLLLLLVSCCFTQQQIVCKVCQQVSQCDESLLYDGNIDLIYNSMAQQLPISNYPVKIECVKTSTEATYTFSWVNDVYQAIVDIKTRAYKVIKSDQNNAVKAVEGVQNALGVRDSSILQTNENIIARIDQDIRAKYFSNINVKCVSIVPGQGGYHAIYEKPDFTRVEFDAVLSTSGGNTFITYKACPISTVVDNKPANQPQGYANGAAQGSGNIWFNVQQNPTPYTINPNQISIKPVTVASGVQVQSNPQVQVPPQAQVQISIAPQTQPIPPVQTPQPTTKPVNPPSTVAGGYSQIPTNDEGVLKIINLLQQFGSIIATCSVIKAERQVVSGFNYRLTIAVEGSSAQYVILIYQALDGTVSVTSSTLGGYKNSYSFSAILTQNELSSLSYLKNLLADLMNTKGSLLTADSSLETVQEDFPYFRLGFTNKTYKKLYIIVLYDVLNRQITIIKQNTEAYPVVPAPALKPAPVQVSIPAPIPEPKPVPSSSIIVVSSPQKLNAPAGYEEISSALRSQSYISKYIEVLAASEPRCSISSLMNIYCKSSDKNSLLYVFAFADGNKQFSASCDYIQYTINNWKPKTTTIVKIANCQTQVNGKCTKCSPKYYLSYGKCVAVPVECSDFNYNTNKCEGCYHGYYLDLTGVCQKADYLCETSDRKGNCLTCFNNYRLTIRGRCVYIAVGTCEELPEQENNPLCSKFNALTCLSCVQGCYMNAKGLCKIPDPNCIIFDEANEVCRTCIENYSLSQTSKTCVPTSF